VVIICGNFVGVNQEVAAICRRLGPKCLKEIVPLDQLLKTLYRAYCRIDLSNEGRKKTQQARQQAARAATQTSKRGKKGGKVSDPDHEEVSDSEYTEYAYRARTDDYQTICGWDTGTDRRGRIE
jgi:hypothetical protein